MAIALPAGMSLIGALRTMPDEVKSEFSDGLAVLERLTPPNWPDLLDATLAVVRSHSHQADYAAAGRKLGIDGATRVGMVLASSSILVHIAEHAAEPPEAVVDAMTELGLIQSSAAKASITSFLSFIVENAKRVRGAIEETRLALGVLPRLTVVEVAVDLRVHAQAAALKSAIPLAVFHIDTTSYQQEIWFQADRDQMQMMLVSIQRAIRSMDAAMEWLEGREPKGEEL